MINKFLLCSILLFSGLRQMIHASNTKYADQDTQIINENNVQRYAKLLQQIHACNNLTFKEQITAFKKLYPAIVHDELLSLEHKQSLLLQLDIYKILVGFISQQHISYEGKVV